MKTRFDLEQEIMNCWNIVDDLERLLKVCENINDSKTEDQIYNVVSGLKSVYDMRFQEMWDTFEHLIGVEDAKLHF